MSSASVRIIMQRLDLHRIEITAGADDIDITYYFEGDDTPYTIREFMMRSETRAGLRLLEQFLRLEASDDDK